MNKNTYIALSFSFVLSGKCALSVSPIVYVNFFASIQLNRMRFIVTTTSKGVGRKIFSWGGGGNGKNKTEK